MPIYEYRCLECGFQDEFLQKLSDPQLTVCPSCGKETMRKMLSAAGFQLKGSGWYATDFKGSGAKPAAKPEGDAKAAGAEAKADPKSGPGTGEGKTEGKTEGKNAGDKGPADSSAAPAPKASAATASN